jgi:hypothetical protein
MGEEALAAAVRDLIEGAGKGETDDRLPWLELQVDRVDLDRVQRLLERRAEADIAVRRVEWAVQDPQDDLGEPYFVTNDPKDAFSVWLRHMEDGFVILRRVITEGPWEHVGG